MSTRLGLITLLVPSYEDGLAFFCDLLGWTVAADVDQGHKRWLVVAPGAGHTGIVLAVPTSDLQRTALGHQTGDRVGHFLYTDDFDRDHTRMQEAGIVFQELPREEPYGTVAVFRDPWGNRWDLIQPAQP